MKIFIKELIIIIIQMIMFYLFPFTAGPTDIMGMVLILLFSTFILSFFLGIVSKTKYKYLYPIITALIFIPSVFIHYNESALIHSTWYLIDSSIGLIIGSIIGKLINKKVG